MGTKPVMHSTSLMTKHSIKFWRVRERERSTIGTMDKYVPGLLYQQHSQTKRKRGVGRNPTR